MAITKKDKEVDVEEQAEKTVASHNEVDPA